MNIAEGAGNDSNEDFCRFLKYSLRSAYEVMTAIDIAQGLEFSPPERCNVLMTEVNEIAAMLVGLMKSLGWKNSKNQ
jgi:four helix bundle protein